MLLLLIVVTMRRSEGSEPWPFHASSIDLYIYGIIMIELCFFVGIIIVSIMNEYIIIISAAAALYYTSIIDNYY